MSAFLRLRESWPGPEAPLRVLGASGQLGFVIPEASLRRGLEARPHVIAADMGSIDPGPTYLGSGRMAAPAVEAFAAALERLDLDYQLIAGTHSPRTAGPEDVKRALAAKPAEHARLVDHSHGHGGHEHG